MYTETIKLYDDREDVTLTTYVIADSAELLNGKKRPAVIICPGGAYLNCSDREGEAVALRFASMGYHAFVLRYSVYKQGQTGFMMTNQEPEIDPNSITPAQIRDLGKAMMIVKSHTDDWLVDNDRVAICGFSAGAHNCAMYSVYWKTDVLSGYFKADPEIFRPAAAILGYMLSDYNIMDYAAMDEMAKGLFKISCLSLTGMTDPDQATIDKVSPALHVNPDTPPMFLWHTFEDGLVPVEHTTRMATALAQNKIPFEVHVFEEGDHGLSLSDQSTAQAKSQIIDQAKNWVPLVEKWLEKRFALDLPEATMWEMPDSTSK